MCKWMAGALLVLWLLVSGARAQALGLGGLPAVPMTARAAVSADPLVPGGEALIAVEVTIGRGYHLQSAFAGKDYIAAHLSVAAVPPGIQMGEVRAQKGTDIPTPPALGTGTLSVYEGKAYFLMPIKVAADASPGPEVLKLLLKTQACTDTACLPPVDTPLQITLHIGNAGDTAKEPDAALFAAARSKQFSPQPGPSTASVTATTSTAPSPLPPTGAGKQVPLLSTAEQLALIAQRPYRPFNASEHEHSLPALLLFALLGGLILNVMPCVLPVIPLKAVSFIQQAHGNPRLALLHGLTFSAGIVTLFIALAVVLRVFGLFYGQQFQSPAFLIMMVMFVVALALSMLGIWTIQPPRAVYAADEAFAHRSGFLGSFTSGLLATLLATPCSAPFLGPVLAWALVQPAWLTAVMLAIVGLGMALPYLVLAIFPQTLNSIPRAGRWSELLKQALGIVMLGVAIYLVTLVPSTRLWPWVLAGAIIVALVCWAWGQIPTPLMSEARIWTIRVVAVVLGLAMGSGIYWFANMTPPPTAMSPTGTAFLPDKTTSGEAWLPFNVALLDQALNDGRPVLVDWTADWCINCRVLEATVLSREELRRAIVEQNAVLLRADLSQDNPAPDALNEKLGSRSIPVLAIFTPARPNEPVVLRDTYSPSRVIKEIQKKTQP
jgi:suppressor for copper-sensitivity B